MAVDQINEAFGLQASATVGVAVVFTLSADALQDVEPVVEVAAGGAAHSLAARTDGRTIHRLIVRIHSKADPRPEEERDEEAKGDEGEEDDVDEGGAQVRGRRRRVPSRGGRGAGKGGAGPKRVRPSASDNEGTSEAQEADSDKKGSPEEDGTDSKPRQQKRRR
jgi:hypothetical protein